MRLHKTIMTLMNSRTGQFQRHTLQGLRFKLYPQHICRQDGDTKLSMEQLLTESDV